MTDPRTQYAIYGSPELIRQVFMNLLDNAVKYSDAGWTPEASLYIATKLVMPP